MCANGYIPANADAHKHKQSFITKIKLLSWEKNNNGENTKSKHVKKLSVYLSSWKLYFELSWLQSMHLLVPGSSAVTLHTYVCFQWTTVTLCFMLFWFSISSPFPVLTFFKLHTSAPYLVVMHSCALFYYKSCIFTLCLTTF